MFFIVSGILRDKPKNSRDMNLIIVALAVCTSSTMTHSLRVMELTSGLPETTKSNQTGIPDFQAGPTRFPSFVDF